MFVVSRDLPLWILRPKRHCSGQWLWTGWRWKASICLSPSLVARAEAAVGAGGGAHSLGEPQALAGGLVAQPLAGASHSSSRASRQEKAQVLRWAEVRAAGAGADVRDAAGGGKDVALRVVVAPCLDAAVCHNLIML